MCKYEKPVPLLDKLYCLEAFLNFYWKPIALTYPFFVVKFLRWVYRMQEVPVDAVGCNNYVHLLHSYILNVSRMQKGVFLLIGLRKQMIISKLLATFLNYKYNRENLANL